MSGNEVIGIVGAYGDLGRQMSVQARSAYANVLSYDIPSAAPVSARFGIDPKLSASNLTIEQEAVDTLEDLVRDSSVVHWCAPIGALKYLGEVGEDTMLVLHDSTMHTSADAERILENSRNFAGSIAVVHCLMNPKKTVVVEENAPSAGRVTKHILELGLNPVQITMDEHDLVMANSQGAMALVSFLLRDLLHDYDEQGLLTKSATELMHSFDHRYSKWAPGTMVAILNNPRLFDVVNEMEALLRRVSTNSELSEKHE